MNYTQTTYALLLTVAAATILRAETGSFPKNDFSPGWKAEPVERYTTPDDLFLYMDGGAELYLEYRFVELQEREYATTAGRETPTSGHLSVEIYQFATPEDACGMFSLDSSGTAVDLGQGGRTTGILTRFWKGSRYVRAFVWEARPEFAGVAEAAARTVAEAIDETGDLPDWLQTLGAAGLNPIFVRGRIALRQLASATTINDIPVERRAGAAWLPPSETLAVGCLALRHETESKSIQAFRRIWEQMIAEGGNAALAGQRGMIRKSDDFVAGVERVGNMVFWVPSAADEDECAETLDKVKAVFNDLEE